MGIEAFCPNGHRMKVKDHLAGKIGVCATCGSRFRLPDLPRPEPAAPAGLPLARLIAIDPSVVRTLPLAMPYGAAAAPPSAVPLGSVPLSSVPLSSVPLSSVPLGGNPPAPAALPSSMASEPFPMAEPHPTEPLQTAPLAEWTPASPSRRAYPRRPRNAGGFGLSIALLVAVAAAAGLAWQILRSRGLIP